MNKQATTLALAVLISGFTPLTAQAYSFLHTQPTDQSTIYRSQRGRSFPSYPTTGNNSAYTNSGLNSSRSDKQARNSIRSLFAHANLSQDNENSRYDNDELGESKIMFTRLVGNTCFEPVGSEAESCKRRFGTYYNLKQSMLNGSIYKILVSNNPNISVNIKSLYQKILAQIREEDATSKVTVVSANKVLIRDRMQDVWNECKSRTTDHRNAAKCYIRNSRLYLDHQLLDINPNFLQ